MKVLSHKNNCYLTVRLTVSGDKENYGGHGGHAITVTMITSYNKVKGYKVQMNLHTPT